MKNKIESTVLSLINDMTCIQYQKEDWDKDRIVSEYIGFESEIEEEIRTTILGLSQDSKEFYARWLSYPLNDLIKYRAEFLEFLNSEGAKYGFTYPMSDQCFQENFQESSKPYFNGYGYLGDGAITLAFVDSYIEIFEKYIKLVLGISFQKIEKPVKLTWTGTNNSLYSVIRQLKNKHKSNGDSLISEDYDLIAVFIKQNFIGFENVAINTIRSQLTREQDIRIEANRVNIDWKNIDMDET
jgi:hypothetical protein